MEVSSLQRLCLESASSNLNMWCGSALNEDFFKYMYIVGPFNDLSSALVQQLIDISCRKRVFKVSYFPLLIHSNITQLNLSICSLMVTDKVLKLLQLRCKNLTHLNLAGCSRLSSKCLREVLPSLPRLKSLNLSFNCLACADHLLEDFSRSGINFQELLLASCTGVTDAGIQALLSQPCPNLYNLNLSSTSVTTETLVFVLEKCPRLRRLSFSNIEVAVKPEIFTDQFSTLELQYLDISDTHFPGSLIKSILKLSPQLTGIKMNENLDRSSLDNLLDLHYLCSLNLEGASSNVLYFRHVAPFLEKQGHQLKLLNLSGMFDIQISALCLYCKELKDLVLADCQKMDATLPTSDILIQQHSGALDRACHLSDFCQLHSLNLSRSSLSTTDTEVQQRLLVNLLVDHNGLQELSMSNWTAVNDDILVNTFESSTNKALRSLDLSKCRNFTMTSVYSVVKNCRGLQSLDLSYCWNVGLLEICEIKEYLKQTGSKLEITWT